MSTLFSRPMPPRRLASTAHRNPAQMSLLSLVGEVAYARQVLAHWERVTTPEQHQRRKGAPTGPRDYADEETFMEMVIRIKRQFVKKGIKPTQQRVATYLMQFQDDRADMLHEWSSKSQQRQRRSVVRRLQRLCKSQAVRWDELT